MLDWVERNRIPLWTALAAAAMVQTWVFGFDATRGTWALLVCMLLLGIRIDLAQLLDAIETNQDEG